MKIKKRKGIILAGGTGSRLNPITIPVSKQLLPVYDKPMIYYPLSTLMMAGIREILLITSEEFIGAFKSLLGNGEHFGIELEYQIQKKPNGLAEAYLLSEEFLGNNPSTLILGDNIFYGSDLTEKLSSASESDKSTIFTCEVRDPERFGVANVNENGQVIGLEEKPAYPTSNFAVTGLYFLDERAFYFAKKLKPSARGELEIVDLLQYYINDATLQNVALNRDYTWMDAGTFDSLLEAGQFVKLLQDKHQKKISCPEEIAIKRGWVDKKLISERFHTNKNNEYYRYLLDV